MTKHLLEVHTVCSVTVQIHGLTESDIVQAARFSAVRLPWQLERSGRWTTVEFHHSVVEFSEADSRLQRVVSFALFVVVATTVSALYSIEFAACTLLLFILFFFSNFGRICGQDIQKLRILRRPDTAADEDQIDSVDIRDILIRENVGRSNIEDERLVQLLIFIESTGQWVLLYQSYYRDRQRVIDVARRLAKWIEDARLG